jgi:hypothetical protein
MKRLAALAVLTIGACGTPGPEVVRGTGDFAFIEVTLKG